MSVRLGMCYHALEEYLANSPSRARITELASTGSYWVRSDWVNPPNPFGNVDMVQWKTDMKNIGVKVLSILDHMTMRESQTFTLNQWRTEVTNAVNSAPDIPAWEIWNEPESSGFQAGYMDGSWEHYLDMLIVARDIIKAVNPNALIVGPATLFPRGYNLMANIIGNGGLDYLDVVSVHAYRIYDNANPKAVVEQVKTMAQGKPVWMTETGWTTYQSNEATQDSYLRQDLATTGIQAQVTFWYELMQFGSSGREEEFGIVRQSGTPRPAYNSFKSLLSPVVIPKYRFNVTSNPSVSPFAMIKIS